VSDTTRAGRCTIACPKKKNLTNQVISKSLCYAQSSIIKTSTTDHNFIQKGYDANNKINTCAITIRSIIVSGYTVAYVAEGTSLPANFKAKANAGGSVDEPASKPHISK
jgi:hypothetical protein